MRAEKREARMRQIEAVAYELLAQVGYEGTSMLAVARRAKASNETMYRWYGDKNGLFLNMVQENAKTVCLALKQQTEEGEGPVATLRRLAPILLGILLGDRAIILNRAAAADASGALGCAIAQGGREAVLPLVQGVIEAAVREGELSVPAEGEMGAVFMHLLVGDQQIRRVIGTMAAPTSAEITAQADVAMAQFCRLCGGVRTCG